MEPTREAKLQFLLEDAIKKLKEATALIHKRNVKGTNDNEPGENGISEARPASKDDQPKSDFFFFEGPFHDQGGH